MDSKQHEHKGLGETTISTDTKDTAAATSNEAAAPAATAAPTTPPMEVKQEESVPHASPTMPPLEQMIQAEPPAAASDASSLHLAVAPDKGPIDAGSEASQQSTEALAGSQSAPFTSQFAALQTSAQAAPMQMEHQTMQQQPQMTNTDMILQYQMLYLGQSLITRLAYDQSLSMEEHHIVNCMRGVPVFDQYFKWLEQVMAQRQQQQQQLHTQQLADPSQTPMRIAHCGACCARIKFPEGTDVVRCPTCARESYVKLQGQINCVSCQQLLRYDIISKAIQCPRCQFQMGLPDRDVALPDTHLGLETHTPAQIREAAEAIAAAAGAQTGSSMTEGAASSSAAVAGGGVVAVESKQRKSKRKPSNVDIAPPEQPATPKKKTKQPSLVQAVAVPEHLLRVVGKKPTRPLTARQHYWKSNRKQFQQLYPRDTLADLNSRMSAQMDQLGPEMLQQWENIAAADRERYEREMLAWNENTQRILSQHDEQEEPAAAATAAPEQQSALPAAEAPAESTLQQQPLTSFLSAQEQQQLEQVQAESEQQQHPQQPQHEQVHQPQFELQAPQLVFPLPDTAVSFLTEPVLKQPAEESEAKRQEEDSKAVNTESGEIKEMETHTQQGHA